MFQTSNDGLILDKCDSGRIRLSQGSGSRVKGLSREASSKVTWKLHDRGHTGAGQAKSREMTFKAAGSTYCIPELIPELHLVVALEAPWKFQGCMTCPTIEMSKPRLRVLGELA